MTTDVENLVEMGRVERAWTVDYVIHVVTPQSTMGYTSV